MDSSIVISWATPVTTNENIISGTGLVWHDGTNGTRQQIGKNKWEALAPDAEVIFHRDDVIAAFNHDFAKVLGRQSNGTLSIERTDNGIAYGITLNPDDSEHQSVRAKINRGDVRGSSATFRILSHRWEADTLLYDAIELIEIGPVTLPAMTATNRFSLSENDYARLAIETKNRIAKFELATIDKV